MLLLAPISCLTKALPVTGKRGWAQQTITQLMSDHIEAEIKDIIVEQLGVDAAKVTADAKFIEDLGADSLDTVELVMAFEDKFSIEVPDDAAENLKCVRDIVEYVRAHQG